MKDHSYFNTILSNFVMGELTKKEEENLRSHLSECMECTENINSLKETVDLFAPPNFDMPQKSYFTSLAPRVRQRAEQNEKKPLFSFLFDVRWTGALATLMLVTVATLLLYNLNSQEDAANAQNEFAYYYGSLQSENYTTDALTSTLNSEEWELLSTIIDEEIGEFIDIFEYDYDQDSRIDDLSEKEWQEFYDIFSKQKIL